MSGAGARAVIRLRRAAGEAELSLAPPEDERLVVYTSHKQELWWPIVREFEERTGIWVDVVTGGSNELLERISEEAESPRADVMFGGRCGHKSRSTVTIWSRTRRRA